MNRADRFPHRFILFTRYPAAGTTKTRLAPLLGPEGAARLQRCLTEDMVERLERAAGEIGAGVEIRFTGGGRAEMEAWLGAGPLLAPQGEGDLGARLDRAFTGAFAGGAERVLVMGSDIPGIGVDLLRRGVARLGERDAVVGPCPDGGYYLVGFRREGYAPRIFEGMPWGGPRVLARTLARLEAEGVRFTLLEERHDLDREEDLLRFAREEAAAGGAWPRTRAFLAGDRRFRNRRQGGGGGGR